MPYLNRVNITFNTGNDNREAYTILHVFVKNRSNTSSDPEENTDYIGNLLAYQRHYDDLHKFGQDIFNPYLAFGKALFNGTEFKINSSNSTDLTLRSTSIKKEDIILPVVNIHILENDLVRWIFDYSIIFYFDDGSKSEFNSTTNGVKGIILDWNNRNYSGICKEVTTNPQTAEHITDALLTKVILEFGTHDDDKDDDIKNDENKNFDTQLNVHIVNRINANLSHDIALGIDILKGEEFPVKSYKSFVWATNTLASNTIRLQDIVLPETSILIIPQNKEKRDRWIFDYRITFEFTNIQSDGFHSILSYSSRTNGIILDQDNNKYSGVYQGNSFPTVTPATAVLGDLFTPSAIATAHRTKRISVSFLKKKFMEFLTSRKGSPTSSNPPLVKLRFHNCGEFPLIVKLPGGLSQSVLKTLPESYLDVQSINAIKDAVNYISSPISLGQIKGPAFHTGYLWFNDINSTSITLEIDPTKPKTPLYFRIDFETGGGNETIGGLGGMNFTQFYIYLSLTLDVDPKNHKIDLLSWVDEMAAQYDEDDDRADAMMEKGLIHVQLHTDNETGDPDGTFKNEMVNKIYKKLTTPDIITRRTVRDDINSAINSLLIGGVIDDQDNNGVNNFNNNVVSDVHFEGDDLVITCSSPRKFFNPLMPADWPNATTNPDSKIDFSLGNLSNIDHIVGLTMDNRSFDHILGYLSLPVNKGGMGRTDVDGLKGGEFNPYKGEPKPSFELTDTYFSPDPSHSYEPVHHAINGGKMDGFVNSYGEEYGDALAGNIMGYHTGKNVPVYDALVRDFAISHRWFASHPGPTFCNRFYELTGMLNINAKGFWEYGNSPHKRPSFTDTIFDHLSNYSSNKNESSISWKYFEHSYCFLRFFEKHTFDNTNIVDINDPNDGFFACAKKGTLPSVSFIDPHYIEFPPNGNCDGPPADIKYGQELVQNVVEAVVASSNWEKTLLIITYDEHGGFYDHIPPPKAVKVSSESPIDTYGVRVPAFFISPWLGQGSVIGHDGHGINGAGSLYFDHTSILKTIARRFMSNYPPYMGARYAAANDLSHVMGNALRRTQFLPFMRYNIVNNASQKLLDVTGGAITPGTQLWQYDANDTKAQHFSFEDAGEGYFYIRTHCGNLYMTIDIPVPVPTPAGAPAGQPAATYGIKQDIKYKSEGFVQDQQQNPKCQKWKLTLKSNLAADKYLYIITNAFFADKVLQAVNTQSQGSVILGDNTEDNLNAWKITIRPIDS